MTSSDRDPLSSRLWPTRDRSSDRSLYDASKGIERNSIAIQGQRKPLIRLSRLATLDRRRIFIRNLEF